MTELNFEAFLAEEAARQHESDQEAQLKKQIAEALFVDLDDQNVVTLHSLDPDEEQRRQDEFIMAAIPRSKAELLEKYPDIDGHPDFEEEVADLAETEYYNRFFAEQVVISIAHMAMMNAATSRMKGEPLVIGDVKKRHMAELMTIYKLSLDEPIMKWLESILPGEPFDPDNPDDAKYISDAFEKYLMVQSVADKSRAVTEEGYVVVNADASMLTDNESYIQTQSKRDAVEEFSRMGFESQRQKEKVGEQQAKAQREASMYEYLRANDTGLSSEEIADLFSLIDRQFPLDTDD